MHLCHTTAIRKRPLRMTINTSMHLGMVYASTTPEAKGHRMERDFRTLI